jgi:hypothetical protein
MLFSFKWFETLYMFVDVLLTTWRNLNVNPKQETTEEQEAGACSLAHSTSEG